MLIYASDLTEDTLLGIAEATLEADKDSNNELAAYPDAEHLAEAMRTIDFLIADFEEFHLIDPFLRKYQQERAGLDI